MLLRCLLSLLYLVVETVLLGGLTQAVLFSCDRLVSTRVYVTPANCGKQRRTTNPCLPPLKYNALVFFCQGVDIC